MKPLLGVRSDSLTPELSQALVRIGLVTAVLALLTVLVLVDGDEAGYGYAGAMHIALAYWVFSLLWAFWVSRARGPSGIRRSVALVADLATTSVTMYVAGPLGAFFYPVYLWIVAGHGLRYGTRFLLSGMVLSVVGFAIVLMFTPYWAQLRLIGAGLLVGLIILPIYQLSLLRRLQHVNRRLSVELRRTVHAARHDALTLLANRGYFFQRLDEEIARAERQQTGFAVVFIDLDGFKVINDQLGHQAGDEVLRQTASRLRKVCRKTDVAARFGGDEFALLIVAENDSDAVQKLISRIASAVCVPIEWQGSTLKVSASVGVSLYPDSGATSDELVHNADLAMYKRKRRFQLQPVDAGG